MGQASYKGGLAYPTYDLDSRSAALLGQVSGIGGMVQPFPATALACTALGWPSPTALWLHDEVAGNLVDKVAALALVPNAGGELYNRLANGVANGTNLWSKVGTETTTLIGVGAGFKCADVAQLNVGANVDFTMAFATRKETVFTAASAPCLAAKFGATGWFLDHDSAVNFRLYLNDGVGAVHNLGNVLPFDGAFHLVTVAVDRNGNVSCYADALATVNVACARLGDLSVAAGFTIHNRSGALYPWAGQVFWSYFCVGTAAARAAHDATWKHMQAAGLGLPNTYTRATPMVCAISATQTACSASGQVAVGYAVGAVSAARGNALGLGQVFENATAFLGIGSNNLPGYSATGGQGIAACDGVNAMRSGLRVTQVGAWNPGVTGRATTPLPYATIGAPSNDNYVYKGWVKRATVGTTARVDILNETGGVAEYVDIYSSAITPVVWTYVEGAFVTVQASNTTLQVGFGCTNNNETCDFSDWAVVKGTTVIPLAMRYCGIGAAETMNCPVELIDNTLGLRFTPAQGTLDLTISGFAGAYSVAVPADLFHAVPAAGDAGRLYWRNLSTGFVEIKAYDAGGLVAWTMSSARVPDSAQRRLRLRWSATAPVGRVAGVDYYAVLEEITYGEAVNTVDAPSAVILDYAGTAPYSVPVATSVPNIYLGSNAGTLAARCCLSLVDLQTTATLKDNTPPLSWQPLPNLDGGTPTSSTAAPLALDGGIPSRTGPLNLDGGTP
jgi:hypothetical protein